MSNVVRLPIQPITHRRCPGCGHVETQKDIKQLSYDMFCRGCGCHRVSEFEPCNLYVFKGFTR